MKRETLQVNPQIKYSVKLRAATENKPIGELADELLGFALVNMKPAKAGEKK